MFCDIFKDLQNLQTFVPHQNKEIKIIIIKTLRERMHEYESMLRLILHVILRYYDFSVNVANCMLNVVFFGISRMLNIFFEAQTRCLGRKAEEKTKQKEKTR